MTARLVMKLTVAAVRRETDEVMHLELRHPRRPQLPPPSPGAHVDVHLPDGRIRQYSLCGDPDDAGAYRIAIKREAPGRGASRWLHAHVEAGMAIGVSAPRNNFPLAAGAARHVFVAGGIGVTPFVPMAQAALRRGESVTLHYCARSEATAPLLGAVRSIEGLALHTWFGDTVPRVRFDAAALPPPEPGMHLYCCGPARLIDAVRDATAHWPDAQRHFEVFQPTLDEHFKPEPFDVTVASTGQTLRVPADRSALAVLREHGLSLPSSCELGVCGACECGYRDGVVIHRDVVLGPAARQDRMMLCVSRARGGVTLDL
ncbi:PDR/VanB family oxidoreductase [Aquincola sp. MAHUQ-54]|uniref:PDR/VanB family oxidoreductase n=1 Tax=Aquincola agrisoli TaxID=3119538 RepID=A0AAW9QG85_9BURK